MEGMEVPDLIGEVTAWRAWNVTETPNGLRITSQGYGGPGSDTVWEPGVVMHATCNKGKAHRSPDEGCTCGFYAARDREHLTTLPYARYREGSLTVRSTPRVAGQVMMDGRVITCSKGYRGENIWPVSIIVPDAYWSIAKPLQDAYGPWGVEVSLGATESVPDPARLQPTAPPTPVDTGPHWCAECGRQLKTPWAIKCPGGHVVRQ